MPAPAVVGVASTAPRTVVSRAAASFTCSTLGSAATADAVRLRTTVTLVVPWGATVTRAGRTVTWTPSAAPVTLAVNRYVTGWPPVFARRIGCEALSGPESAGAPNDRLAVPVPVVARTSVSTARRGWTRPAPSMRGS